MEKLKLLKPISGPISQKFGEDNACITSEGKTVSIVSGKCPKGSVSIYKQFGLKGHNGLDIVAYDGQPVFASHDGTVLRAENDGPNGIRVDLVSDTPYLFKDNRAFYIKSTYAHLKDYSVKVGQKVTAGEVIAHADNTGYSTATHLHFGCKKVFKSHWNWDLVEPDNGYAGCFDPLPYLYEGKQTKPDLIFTALMIWLEIKAKLTGRRPSLEELQNALKKITQ